LSVQKGGCDDAKHCRARYAEPEDGDVPSLEDDAQEEERY
jgi:hypothetical protein